MFKHFGANFPFVEVLFSFFRYLISLVSLARKQNNRTGSGKTQRCPYGLPAVGHTDGFGPSGRGESRADFGHNIFRFLAAAVVGGDNNPVREFFGNGGHLSKYEDELLDCLNYCVKKYGSRIVIDVCYEYNEEHLKLNELKSRCFYKKSDSENPTSKDVNYIVKILYNRNKIYFSEKKMIYLQINSIARQFYGTYKYKEFVVQLTNKASNCEDWIEFKEYLSSLNI